MNKILNKISNYQKTGLLSALIICMAMVTYNVDAQWNIKLNPPNGNRIPQILGASSDLDVSLNTSMDYFRWFGITDFRFWFRQSITPLSNKISITDAATFTTAKASIRANPLRQGTPNDQYIDWKTFQMELSKIDGDSVLTKLKRQGIRALMVNTSDTGNDPLSLWSDKFTYWRMWYSFVFYFATKYDVELYEFKNEPDRIINFTQWQSHWIIAADAMRAAMEDVNANAGKNLKLYICGPVTAGEMWSSWGSQSWTSIQTDIYGNKNNALMNFGMYDYHHYSTSLSGIQSAITNIRTKMASATPSSAMPIVITEINSTYGSDFDSKQLDTEDLSYGIGTSRALTATATLGSTNGLKNEGGFYFFKIGESSNDVAGYGIINSDVYMSGSDNKSFGGITRGGACFQLYSNHFKGSKPMLELSTTAGSSSNRTAVAAWDEAKRAYYIYLSNANGSSATTTLDLSSLDVQAGAIATVARVDLSNTGQITEILNVSTSKTITFNTSNYSTLLVWVNQSVSQPTQLLPTNDTYLVITEKGVNRGSESTLKISQHHATAGERRLGFLQFDLRNLVKTNRYLLKLPGHNIGTDPNSRTIFHVYGTDETNWTESTLTWESAPGVGKYYTSPTTMAPTTGEGAIVDIEDNYKGFTSGAGTGLGLYGKFLGPISYTSANWTTGYVDVTDYVNSLIQVGKTGATFILASIVRYDVNKYNNAYYTAGVYDYSGKITEIGSKENTTADNRAGLLSIPTGVNWVNVSTVSITTSKTTISTGYSQQLTADVLPGYATNTNICWTSSNPAVATVNETGLVTAVSEGTTTVTATSVDGAKTASVQITVQSIPVSSVSVSPATGNIYVGVSLPLKVTILPENATNLNVNWSTANAAIATVNSEGVVTGVAAGTTAITATSVDGAKTGSMIITVKSADELNKRTFNPIEDADVYSGNSTANYGTLTYFRTKQGATVKRKSYVKFDVSTLDFTKISNAKIRLYCSGMEGGAYFVSAYEQPTDSWNELGMSWSIAPAFGSVISAVNVTNIGSYYEWDVTSYVQSQINGDKKVSICFWDAASNNLEIKFNSREATSNQPELVILSAPNALITHANESKLFSIYPNPVRGGIFNIKLHDTETGNNPEITISTLQGQIVYKKEFTTGSPITINTNKLLKGSVYLLSIKNGNSISYSKLIIQ